MVLLLQLLQCHMHPQFGFSPQKNWKKNCKPLENLLCIWVIQLYNCSWCICCNCCWGNLLWENSNKDYYSSNEFTESKSQHPIHLRLRWLTAYQATVFDKKSSNNVDKRTPLENDKEGRCVCSFWEKRIEQEVSRSENVWVSIIIFYNEPIRHFYV